MTENIKIVLGGRGDIMLEKIEEGFLTVAGIAIGLSPFLALI